MKSQTTVGELKKLLEDVSDDKIVYIEQQGIPRTIKSIVVEGERCMLQYRRI